MGSVLSVNMLGLIPVRCLKAWNATAHILLSASSLLGRVHGVQQGFCLCLAFCRVGGACHFRSSCRCLFCFASVWHRPLYLAGQRLWRVLPRCVHSQGCGPSSWFGSARTLMGTCQGALPGDPVAAKVCPLHPIFQISPDEREQLGRDAAASAQKVGFTLLWALSAGPQLPCCRHMRQQGTKCRRSSPRRCIWSTSAQRAIIRTTLRGRQRRAYQPMLKATGQFAYLLSGALLGGRLQRGGDHCVRQGREHIPCCCSPFC